MTATTTAGPALESAHLSFPGLLRSEWIKLRTVRSTMWCYGLIIIGSVAFGLLLSLAINFSSDGAVIPDASQKQAIVQMSTMSVNLTQLVAAVLGVLVISGEFGTGMIRSTFTAAPRRIGAYLAKLLVLAVVTFVVGLISVVLTALVNTPVLAAKGVDPHFGAGDLWLPLIGGAGYLALIAALAYTFGAIVRNSAGGIACILGLLLVVPSVLQMAGGLTGTTWLLNIAQVLPSSAGSKLFEYQLSDSLAGGSGSSSDVISLDPTMGLIVTLAWVVVLAVLGGVLIKRRDV